MNGYYQEDPLQKTNQGGLTNKNSSKTVYVYCASDRRRCPVRLFKKYVGLLPQTRSCRKLYLHCRKAPTPSTWFCDQPYGVNKIKSVVKEICKEGGLEGYFTNHSLRATCASRMYAKNVPEQIIKETTGHRSACVRVYKRTGDHLREAASKTLGDEPMVKKSKDDEKCKIESGEGLSFDQMIENVNKTKEEIRKKLVPKYRLKAKRLLQRAKKVTIDLNLNMKLRK